MSAQVTETAHGSLGLAVDDLLGMHRTMVTARLIDEAALRQNRMGRAPFVVPVSGHEGCQIGTAWPMRRGTDIWVPYYRDLGVVLVAGMTPEQIFLGVFSKATDPTSGGRQMPATGVQGSRDREPLLTDLDTGAARGKGSPTR